MEDQNVIILLDKIHKYIELKAYPKAIIDIEATIELLEKHKRDHQGKLFDELPAVYNDPVSEELRLKINEIARWANTRFVTRS